MKALIVGAGLSGLTAGVLLKRKGWDVLVLETRNHIGGNCIDYLYNGVHVHQYGPHIFHTNDERVAKFVAEFTTLTPYRHRVMAEVSDGTLLPIPYNKVTAEKLGRELTDDEIKNMFFRHYTQKMWGMPYDQVPQAITGRVNLRRDNDNCDYFLDRWQGMPSAGYEEMFNRMANEIGHARIHLSAHQTAWEHELASCDLAIFTGRMDEYYNYEFGRLPYRAIQFDIKHAQTPQPYAVINYCSDKPATRTTDYGKLYARTEGSIFTVTCTEYPMCWDDDSGLVPSYPMRGFPEPDHQVEQYSELSPDAKVLLMGRLGTYRYMNMDATIAQVMARLEFQFGEPIYA